MPRPQRVLLLAALVAVCATITPTPAHADGLYFTEGAGGGKVENELGSEVDSTFRVRVGLGWRHRRWAVEAWFGLDDEITTDPPEPYYRDPAREPTSQADGNASFLTYGMDLKYISPLGGGLEGYVRGSISNIVSADAYDSGDRWGRGLGAGVGLQVKGHLRALGLIHPILFLAPWGPKLTVGAFIDAGVDYYRLRRDGEKSVDAQLNRLTLGIALGSDF